MRATQSLRKNKQQTKKHQCSVLLEATLQKSGNRHLAPQTQAIVPGASGGDRTKRAEDRQPSLEEGKAECGERQKLMSLQLLQPEQVLTHIRLKAGAGRKEN